MIERGLLTRQITYARLRAQGLSAAKAYRGAGYRGAETNAYRLENRPDVQQQIERFRKERAELLSYDESNPVKAEALSDPAFAASFLLNSLLTALGQAKASGDAKATAGIVKQIADMLSVQFNADALKDATGDNSTASLLAQLEALK